VAFSQVMNIRMTYLYRDGGNYKYWQDVVFPNRTSKSAADLTVEIRKCLISGQFFEQALAPIPVDFDDEYDEDLDHSWLEFYSLEEVNESPQVVEDVTDFIAKLI